MKKRNSDLAVIQQVRKLRVESLRRSQLMKAQEKQAASDCIANNLEALESLRLNMIAAERETLANLTGRGFVKVDALVGFTKLQRDGVRQVNNQKLAIEESRLKYQEKLKEHEESIAKTLQAEKRLMGLEEILKGKSWN